MLDFLGPCGTSWYNLGPSATAWDIVRIYRSSFHLVPASHHMQSRAASPSRISRPAGRTPSREAASTFAHLCTPKGENSLSSQSLNGIELFQPEFVADEAEIQELPENIQLSHSVRTSHSAIAVAAQPCPQDIEVFPVLSESPALLHDTSMSEVF